MTSDELKKYIKKSKLPNKNKLKQRFEMSGILLDNIITVLSSKKVLEFENKFVKKSNEIKGNVVFPGKVIGKCRIVFFPSKAVFKKGEILVAPNTRPNFISLINKSAAIITETGGILSHAAIVARELKKPCIIGTGNATSVLKDGDLVEVDAEKGIVRKIK